MKWSKYIPNAFIKATEATPDQADQTWGSLPQDLYCQGQDVLSPGTHRALYSKERKKKKNIQRGTHISLKKIMVCSACRKHPVTEKIRIETAYHGLDYIIRPCELSGSLTSCHTFPVLINEGNNILENRATHLSDTFSTTDLIHYVTSI